MPVILNPWSYEYIRQLAEEATILAAQQGLRPALPLEIARSYKHSHRLNIPFLGDYVPAGWERLEQPLVFVDTTGRGKPGDPAITTFEFYRRITQHTNQDFSVIGYGVIEQGQTQALVATYRKEEHGN